MFAGVFSRSAETAPEEFLAVGAISQALAPYRRPDAEGFWFSGAFGILCQGAFVSRKSTGAGLPELGEDGEIAAHLWGHLHDRDTLESRLSISGVLRGQLSDSQLLHLAWRQWGESLPEQLQGDFALVILDRKQKKIFLARDALGTKPLYYSSNRHVFAFASSAAALKKINTVDLTVNQAWITRFLVGDLHHHTETAFASISKLPPGHSLVVQGDGCHKVRRWFQFPSLGMSPGPAKCSSELLDDYRHLLEEVIRCRIPADFPIGVENSGGLDSGTLMGYLSHLLGDSRNRLVALGNAISEPQPELLLEASLAHNILHSYCVTANSPLNNYVDAQTRSTRVIGYPEDNGNGVNPYLIFQECERHGVRTLFSGFGGDEAVTQQATRLRRYECLDNGQYRELFRILPGNPLTRVLRLLKVSMLWSRPLPHASRYFEEALEDSRHFIFRADREAFSLARDTLMERARFDGPYRRINDFVLDRVHAPYVSTRFESCTLNAASFGIEYQWPLLDTRLIQQYLATPSEEKVGPRGIGRYLHRRAINGIVSPKIIWNMQSSERISKHITPTNPIEELRSAAATGRQLSRRLHPILDDVIDRKIFDSQIQRAMSGETHGSFKLAFEQSVGATERLNQWLTDEYPA